ncbi:MAG TPA: hypothetical protein VFN28_10080, partial [Amaricoccus sp.]|nr:hypothetical protein [Amaricoccus sp.]
MAEDGRLARVAGRSASAAEPTLSELLDPIALEERLRAARARRAEALARRPAADAAAPLPPEPAEVLPAAAPVPEPEPVPAPVPAAILGAASAVLVAPPRPLPPRAAPARGLPAVPILVFLAGLGLGGAAVAVFALQA